MVLEFLGADQVHGIDDTFLHAVGGLAARGRQIQWVGKPVRVLAVKFPKQEEYDGRLARARASRDNQVFVDAAYNRFGLLCFEPHRISVCVFCERGDFFDAFFRGPFYRGVRHKELADFLFDSELGIEILGRVKVIVLQRKGFLEKRMFVRVCTDNSFVTAVADFFCRFLQGFLIAGLARDAEVFKRLRQPCFQFARIQWDARVAKILPAEQKSKQVKQFRACIGAEGGNRIHETPLQRGYGATVD